MTRIATVMWLVLCAVSVEVKSAEAPAGTVPFVGCPADGQMGPVAPPAGHLVTVRMPAQLSTRLAYYKGDYAPGVLAPAGWSCRVWYGSNGAFIIVMPTAPTKETNRTGIAGPGVEFLQRNGGTSGRFEVAITAARFFPTLMTGFIQHVREEKLIEDKYFAIQAYPDDRTVQIAANLVEFTTPAGSEGFGTEGFGESASPVSGLVAISDPQGEPALWVLRVRLEDMDAALTTAIIKLEEECLQHGTSC